MASSPNWSANHPNRAAVHDATLTRCLRFPNRFALQRLSLVFGTLLVEPSRDPTDRISVRRSPHQKGGHRTGHEPGHLARQRGSRSDAVGTEDPKTLGYSAVGPAGLEPATYGLK